MEKKLTVWSAVGFALLYFVCIFGAAFLGFIAPTGWVLAPVVGAFLGAFPYRWLALRWHRFGLGTLLAAVVGVLCLAMGEMDVTRCLLVLCFGVLSDVVRLFAKDVVAYPVLAVGNLALIIYLWTKTEWYHAGAVEEMGQRYADGLMAFATPQWLCLDVVLIAVMAVVGFVLAKRWIK